MNKNISKGGLIGAAIGAAASTQIHRQTDSLPKKVIKTGILASIGYFLGSLTERLISKNHTSVK